MDEARELYPPAPAEPDVGSEMSVVPLDKDSFGLCSLCGTVGLKRNFYSRDYSFCSLYCYRRHRSKRRNYRFTVTDSTEQFADTIPMEPLPQLEHPWPADIHDLMRRTPPKSQAVLNSYEWKDELFGCDFLAAPVKLFKHAPLHDMWDATLEGMKVEVRNTDCENNKRMSDYFWVASVLKIKGYMGLLRYEGFGSDDSKDFWVNLCCSDVHPVGWCATRGNPLIPPRSIESKYTDWKKFLVRQLTGARTLPIDFYTKLEESLKSRFRVGTVMEVVDKDRITQVKVASVCEIIGKRLHIKYYDSQPEDEGFWCHEDSPLIHPVGWAFRVGHPLDAPLHYMERAAAGRMLHGDATPDMFCTYPDIDPSRPLFHEGMKLEAIDPLNLSSICAATVMQVLGDGYMMIRIDVYPADASNSDWFCYHQRSPCIFPVGFCAANKLKLIPPAGYTSDNFSWSSYLAACGAAAAGEDLFSPRSSVEHGFVAGMRLECTDLMGPQLVCVATVARVVGNLLKVHFDGWGEEYDQWLWGHSTDMYPVGWCRAVGYRLEGPLQAATQQRPPPKAVRKKKRKQRAAHVRDPPNKTPQPIEDTSQSDTQDTKMFGGIQEGGMEEGAMEEGGMEEEQMQVKEEEPEVKEEEYVKEEIEEVKEEGMEDVTEEGEAEREEEVNAQTEPEVMMEDTADVDARGEPEKTIPRLVNNTPFTPPADDSFDPELWTTGDVSKFLSVNDCSVYRVNFSHVAGPALLALSKDDIIELMQMKVGPSLKIYDLLKQLKAKMKPHARIKYK